MTDPTKTRIVMVVDRSGSMKSTKLDTEAGFNAYVAEQRSQPGDCTLTLVQFDDKYEVVYTDKPIAAVPPLTIVPCGSTALLDAIGRTITSVGAELAALPEDRRPGTVVFGIVTDGLENASQEFARPTIKAMIEEQEKTYSWTFMYLGANQDAIEVGAALGVAADRALTYTGVNAAPAMAAYSRATRTLRAAAAGGRTIDEARLEAAYTSEERTDSTK